MPRPMMMAITMRMILRALLPPPVEAGGAGGRGDNAAPGATGPAGTAAPHLLQNFVPAVRAAPQELQNAIGHLVDGDDIARRASIPQILWADQDFPGPSWISRLVAGELCSPRSGRRPGPTRAKAPGCARRTAGGGCPHINL